MPLEGMVTHSQFQAPGAGSGSGSGRDVEVIKTKIRDTSIISSSSLDLEHMLTMKGKGKGTADDDEGEEEERSETSSIGVCSSSSAEEEHEEEEEEEVQSKPKPVSLSLSRSHSPVNDNENQSSLSSLDSLEDSLPFKRGLSNFYSGKSKSFTTLSSAANATAKDIVKPENPLNKRRRLFIARSRFRRASCSSLVSIVESPLLQPLLPPENISECDEEEEEEDDDEDEDEDEGESLDQVDEASPSPSSSDIERLRIRRSHTLRARRPSLFTVSVSPFEARPDRHDPFPTPKSVRASTSGASKMPLKSPARSLSLSDLSRHAHPSHPMPAFD